MYNGVVPSFLGWLASAPASSKSLVISECPFEALMYNDVLPLFVG
eukprot:SAG31_NODE_662_length_13028_cov_3.364529_9_plen_45_part_00